jgi:transcriptional regulator with GAF, ATPase, and Fis domain
VAVGYGRENMGQDPLAEGQLIESELFGHDKGAFTGASDIKRGRFERAHMGTIFLDEIGELPLFAQTRLLHVLQHRKIERVGGTEYIDLDIRIICASNRNLEEMVRKKRFREDLWFRINVFPIYIAPLRHRKTDIPEFVYRFLEKKAKELRLQSPYKLAPGTLESLMAYDWPGNVRELENLVERALIQNTSGVLSFDTPMPASNNQAMVENRPDPIKSFTKLDEVVSAHIKEALQLCKGKINGPGGIAELLGIHPSTLRKRMDKLGVSYGRQKS